MKTKGHKEMTDPRMDPDAFLSGTKVASASFLRVGDFVEGEVVGMPKVVQQRNFKTKKSEFWDNGDPKLQLMVELATEDRDPKIENDNGHRRIYAKYKMRDALNDALAEASKAAGTEVKIRPGGWLTVTFTSQDAPENGGGQGTKHYEATYEPPDGNADADAFLAQPDPEAEQEPDEPAPPAAAKKPSGRAKAGATSKAAAPTRVPRGRPAADPAKDEASF